MQAFLFCLCLTAYIKKLTVLAVFRTLAGFYGGRLDPDGPSDGGAVQYRDHALTLLEFGNDHD